MNPARKVYKFMEMRGVSDGYFVFNKRNNSILGTMRWHETWKSWVFEGEMGSIFDVNCLLDLVDFIKGLEEPEPKCT